MFEPLPSPAASAAATKKPSSIADIDGDDDADNNDDVEAGEIVESNDGGDDDGEYGNAGGKFVLCGSVAGCRQSIPQERSDYVILLKQQWELLMSWYGGGPPIARVAVSEGGGAASLSGGSGFVPRATLDLRGVNVVCVKSGDEAHKKHKVAANLRKNCTVGDLRGALAKHCTYIYIHAHIYVFPPTIGLRLCPLTILTRCERTDESESESESESLTD